MVDKLSPSTDNCPLQTRGFAVRNKIVFYLNGKRHSVGATEASMMLSDYLRYDQGLTGTKVVCAEGDCGACSVLRFFPHAKGVDWQNYIPVNSCITQVATLDGSSLLTVEALKDNDRLHEAQRAMVDCHGSQCGFCTPGFVVTLGGLVEEKISKNEKTITEQEAKNCLTGNLCRCTGYQGIIDAAVSVDLKIEKSLKSRYFDKDQEKDLVDTFNTPVEIKHDDFIFFAPKTIKEACTFLENNPDCRIIASSTDLGVVHNKRRLKLEKLLSLHLIPELYQIVGNDQVSLGARVTHTEFRHFIKDTMPEIAHYLDLFASPQIKNLATVVGNVATASPIGDTPPVFLALDAKLVLASSSGERVVNISDFFLDYRKTLRKPNEIIVRIEFDLPKKSTLKAIKNSNRKDLDISAVNMVMNIEMDSAKVVKEIRLAAGGIAAIPLRLKKTEDSLRGQKLDKKSIEAALSLVHSEFNPLSDLRASSAYRRIVVENSLSRFLHEEAAK